VLNIGLIYKALNKNKINILSCSRYHRLKSIALLGSTGSIGTQVLDVARNLKGGVCVKSLSAHSNITLVKEQIKEFRPELVSVWEETSAQELKKWCVKNHLKVNVLHGREGLISVAVYKPVTLVISAVVGAAGLVPLLKAIDAGKNIALANKEALVAAGDIVMKRALQKGVDVLPVDSEHSAIFQCLGKCSRNSINKLILTASGGPFYRSKKEPASITVAEALAHPTWIMGKKITIDSATLMNKGLEAIEAHHLFGVPMDKIEIVIHPQSIVHSLVEFLDGSILAQLSNPDMRLPIQYALTYPERAKSPVKQLDLSKRPLEFFKPEFKKFPCLQLALKAAGIGGTMPAAMNAANETAVNAFLTEKIGFADIPKVISKVMASHKVKSNPVLKDILAADSEARELAEKIIHSV
jgi:1-deoxy-D-xylulose-5-phosphate reductoisomerase